MLYVGQLKKRNKNKKHNQKTRTPSPNRKKSRLGIIELFIRIMNLQQTVLLQYVNLQHSNEITEWQNYTESFISSVR